MAAASHITIVLHGPELFDAGDVSFLADRIRPSRIIVAGVMARTAAEESGIACEFISDPPSVVIKGLQGVTVLANHGKTPESGRIFGEIVAARLFPDPLVQVECADRKVYGWNNPDRDLVALLASRLGFEVEHCTATAGAARKERRIRGCLPGEAVYVNGLVIGHATGSEVMLRSENGVIIPVSGLVPKPHGLEKLSRQRLPELARAWCKSGPIRTALPRSMPAAGRPGRVLFIDHCGHAIYRDLGEGVCGMVSIGDDTTSVCGHIGAHLGIPVFGITDGDGDRIVPEKFIDGSCVVRAVDERDDDLGNEIRQLMGEQEVVWEDLVESLLHYLGPRVTIMFPPE